MPKEGHRTRLIARLKDCYSWRAEPNNALLPLILFEFGTESLKGLLKSPSQPVGESRPPASLAR
jgi:hypothetical protein